MNGIVSLSLICYNTSHMVQVTRKDEREANENIIRRFNRKVLQSGVLAEAKASMRFAKPISKPERRAKAIIRKERKADKLNKARLGLK
jgi:ribosomal protein S21